MRKNEKEHQLLGKILENGQKKRFSEIAEEAVAQLGAENFDIKRWRNMVYLMKSKGELERTEDGRYYKTEVPPKNEKEENGKEEKKASKYDFRSFVQVKASGRKETEEILGVWKNGELTINAKLLKHFPEHKIDIRISPDCLEIVLFPKGEEMINVGKNGRTKNYDLQKKLKEQKKNLPAYYVGEWDEEEQLWYGKYLPYNPNRGEKQIKK